MSPSVNFNLLPELHYQRPLPRLIGQVCRTFLAREETTGAVRYLVSVEKGFKRLKIKNEGDRLLCDKY